MKFAIVAVVLALALGAQSGLIPARVAAPLSSLGPFPLSAYSAFSAYPYSAYPLFRAPLRFDYAPAHHVVAAAPAVYAPIFTGEGTYVAKTLGSAHIAPLPGHAESAASINLEPAPGTE